MTQTVQNRSWTWICCFVIVYLLKNVCFLSCGRSLSVEFWVMSERKIMQTQTNAWWVLEVQNVVVILGNRTLGAREFSCMVCGFGQVFIVIPTQKASGQCFDSTETIASTVWSRFWTWWLIGSLIHLRDFESNRCHNWLTGIGHHMKEYFKLCCLC